MDKVTASNGKKTADKSRTPDHAVDGDAFARLLEEKVTGSAKDSDKEHDMIAGKEAKKGSPKEAREHDEQARQRILGNKMDHMVGTRNFIYNIALKDPSSLSMAERQSLHLGEFSRGHLDVKDFQNALADKGLQLKDLSFTQISTLTRSSSKAELSEALDKMDFTRELEGASQTKAGQGGKGAARSSRFPNSPLSAAYTEFKTGLGGLPVHVPGLRNTDAADARKLQREDVIKQIMSHIDVQKIANATEVSLKLNPEFLGDMRIKLNFESKGHIAADFETTSKDTKALIEEGMDSLKDSFSRHGMTLTRGTAHLVDHVG